MRPYVAVRQIEGAGRYLESLDLFFAATRNGRDVCDGVCIRPAWHRPCNVRLPAGTNELLLDVVLRTNIE